MSYRIVAKAMSDKKWVQSVRPGFSRLSKPQDRYVIERNVNGTKKTGLNRVVSNECDSKDKKTLRCVNQGQKIKCHLDLI